MERIQKEAFDNTKTIWQLEGWFEKTVFVIGALHIIYYGFMFLVGFWTGLFGALIGTM
jgi:prolipoprotein diacylglyceryltransferase